MTRIEEQWQEERTLEENTIEEYPHSHFETLEVDERLNVTIDGTEMKSEVEASEREREESNEAGNVILCCFAVLLIHLYYFDL